VTEKDKKFRFCLCSSAVLLPCHTDETWNFYHSPVGWYWNCNVVTTLQIRHRRQRSQSRLFPLAKGETVSALARGVPSI